MADKKLSTEPYKGVRDFYPEDMAVQNYIFRPNKKCFGNLIFGGIAKLATPHAPQLS